MARKRASTGSSRPRKAELKVDGDVQGDLNVAGRDIIQNKTIIQRLPWRVIGVALAVIVLGLIAVALVNNLSTGRVASSVNSVGTQVGDVNSGVSTLVAPTALPFPVATGDEVLVIVTDFTGESVDARIYNALRDRVAESGFTTVRVERLRGVAPETAEEAVAVGELFNATLVIWGIADSGGIEPHYEVISHQSDIQTSVDLGVTPAFDQPSFSAYVVYGVSNEFEYLMLFSLGQIAYFNQDYVQAIGLFDEALRIDLGERQSLLEVGTLYFYRGFAHNEHGDVEAALADYAKAIELDPTKASAYHNRGTLNKNLGDVDAALADYSKAIELDPEDASAYIGRGLVYHILGDLDAALADNSKAIELDPEDTIAYSNRGLVYRTLGDFDAALADFFKAIELDSKDVDAYTNRGLIYAEQGDLDAALADYSKAIELDPEYARAYNNRGNVYSDLGDLDAALADYNKAIALNPQYAKAYNNRGILYRDLGDLDAALADYNKAIEIDPDYLLAYNNRGYAYEVLGDIDAALADYSKEIELDPYQSDGYHFRAFIFYKLGRYEEGLSDANNAINLGELGAYYTRGLIYQKLGRNAEAIADFTQFIKDYEGGEPQKEDARQRITNLGGTPP